MVLLTVGPVDMGDGDMGDGDHEMDHEMDHEIVARRRKSDSSPGRFTVLHPWRPCI